MIALRIVPLMWADPESKKVLVPDTGRTAYEWRGTDGEGFYSASQAVRAFVYDSGEDVHTHHHLDKMVATDPLDGILVSVVREFHQSNEGQIYALFAVWFSSDEDTFVETPLLTLPNVPEEAQEPAYDPETHKWSIGDWFFVTKFLTKADEKRGAGPFRVEDLEAPCFLVPNQGLYCVDQVRPCPAPATEGASPQAS